MFARIGIVHNKPNHVKARLHLQLWVRFFASDGCERVYECSDEGTCNMKQKKIKIEIAETGLK